MTTLKDWAYKNGFGALYENYSKDCDEIAAQCAEEGYPAYGSNYELRIENLKRDYPELFEEGY